MNSKRSTHTPKFSLGLSPIFEASEGSPSHEIIMSLRERFLHCSSSPTSCSWYEEDVEKSFDGRIQTREIEPPTRHSTSLWTNSPYFELMSRVEKHVARAESSTPCRSRGPSQVSAERGGAVGKYHTSFVVRQVTVERGEGEDLGFSFVPSCGVTRSFYKIKRVLTSGACGRQAEGVVEGGDILLQCNGHVLQSLPQHRCLQQLQHSGPRVTLTLLRHASRQTPRDRRAAGWSGPGPDCGEIVCSQGGTLLLVGCSAHGTADLCGLAPERCCETETVARERDRGVVTTVPHERESGASRSSDEREKTSVCRTGPSIYHGTRTATFSGISDQPLASSNVFTSPAMSNPFLDPFGDMGDDASDCQPQNGHSVVSTNNPFYEDLLGGDFTCGPGANQENSLPDTLIDFQDENPSPNPRNDRVATAEDVLLDLGSDASGQGPPPQSQPPGGGLVDLLGSSDVQFGDSFAGIPPPMEFSDPFTAQREGSARPDTYVTPVTNIDDLLGLDFMTSLDPVSEEGADSELSRDGACLTDGLVLVPDVRSCSESAPAKESGDVSGMSPQVSSESSAVLNLNPPPIPADPPPDLPDHPPPIPPPMTSTDLMQDNVDTSSSDVTVQALNYFGISTLSSSEEQTLSPPAVSTDCPVINGDPQVLSEKEECVISDARVPSPVVDASPGICEDDPPALPSHPPPLASTDQVVSTAESSSTAAGSHDVNNGPGPQATVNPSNTTTLFLPSPNPADNVTQVTVTSEHHSGHQDNNNSSNNSNNNNNMIHITDIAVTPASAKVSSVTVTKPRPGPREAEGSRERAGGGVAVVVVDNSSMPSATHIQFDNSTQETVVKSTLPPNAFRPTSIGVTRAVKPTPTTTEEEEEITPMMVHRDHQGNPMAAPSPPETLGRQSQKPRKLDEAAKHDLQVVLSRMTEANRGPAAKRKPAEDDGPAAREEEIVPVKLTRQQAEVAQEVLSSWMTRDKESVSSSSAPAKVPRSGFQRAVGTIINVQSGKQPLPDNCLFLTTIGVPNTSRQTGVQEQEEEIIPMALHKDHLGHQHYAPSPPQSLSKQSGRRQLDSAATRDMADLLSGMAPRTKKLINDQKAADKNVSEDRIVATVLSREESRLATEAVTRWLAAEKPSPPPATSSPFQRLVENVMDSADKPNHEKTSPSVDQTDHGDARLEKSQDHSENSNITECKEVAISQSVQLQSTKPPQDTPKSPRQTSTQDNGENSNTAERIEVISQSVQLQSTAPAPDTPKSPTRQTSTQSNPLTDSNRSSTQNSSQPIPEKIQTTSELPRQKDEDLRTTSKQPRQKDAEKPQPVQNGATQIVVNANRSATAVEAKPVSTQRAQNSAPPSTNHEASTPSSQRAAKAPAKIATLSQPSALSPSSKPLPKLAPLSVGSRVPVSSFSSSRLSTRVDYAKSRNDDSPFLVEVLKGIVGLGIKVKVNGEGHVEVTEVQRNSPVAKNGNVRVGDYLLSINTTELRGLTDGRVQQVLRLLPRGLIKLVVSTRPPAPLTPAQGNDVGDQASPRAGGAYSPFGVRLSPRPFSPSADRQTPAVTSDLPTNDTATLTAGQSLGPSSPTPAVQQSPTVSPSVSSASTVSAVASKSSSLSSTLKPTAPLATSSLPSSEKEAASSTIVSRQEKCDVAARVSPASEDPASSSRESSVSASSEPRTRPDTVRTQEEESASTPEQPSSSSSASPSSKRDSQLSKAGASPSDAEPSRQAVPATAPPLPKEALSSSVHEESGGEDMEPPKLSRALSPRLPSTSSQLAAEQASPPRPTPRQRTRLAPASPPPVVERRNPDAQGGGDGEGGSSPAPEPRPMTASEIVALASKRPSGRDTDLPSPPSSPRRERADRTRSRQEPQDLVPPSRSGQSGRTPARDTSPREEVSKTSPVPTPRPRSRLFVETKQNRSEENRSSDDSKKSVQSESQQVGVGGPEKNSTSGCGGGGVVHAHLVTIAPGVSPSAEAPPSKVPPPPLATRSPRQPLPSDSSAKEAPSPTLVSARLRAFADPNVPTLEDQAPNRRFVSSAARMFEQKASENSACIPFSKRTKSSVSVSSAVRSLNTQDADVSSSSGVTMRKKRADRGDQDLSERRKSTPGYYTGSSLSLTSGNLSHVKHLSASTVTLSPHSAEQEPSHHLNSALSPRQSRANTTPLKSLLASAELGEGRRSRSPPSVGKRSTEFQNRTSMFDVTLRSRPSRHDPHGTVTTHSNRKSWSPQTSDSQYPSFRPYTPTSSSSPRRADRFGSSLSSALSSSMSSLVPPRRAAAQSGSVDSTVRKFDDLLTTRHAADSDEELPKVSNRLNLEFSPRSSRRTAAQPPEAGEKSAEQSAVRTEAGKRIVQLSGGRSEISNNTDHKPDWGIRTGRSSEHLSARRTEVKPLDQSTVPPLSPRSTLPHCWKSPDEFVVEERKSFSFNDNEIHAQETEDVSEKNTTGIQQQGTKPDLQHASEEVSEAAVGYILTGGLLRKSREAKTREEVQSKIASENPESERQKNSSEDDTVSRITRKTRRGVNLSSSDETINRGSVPKSDISGTLIPTSQPGISQTEGVVKSSADSGTQNTFKDQTAHAADKAQPADSHGDVTDPEEKKDVKGDDDDDDDDSPPPPLPDEGPPPLPGAPPPSLPVSRDVDLADVGDLEGMLPAQGTTPGRTDGTTPARGKDTTPSNTEEDADTMAPGVTASTYGQPLQPTATTSPQIKGEKPGPDPDPPSSPTHLPPPSTDLLGFSGREDKDLSQDNPPVSDTLSQDSGVQDEDMSEDGLRLSMDDSPTNTSLFDSAVTPDEAPASVLNESLETPESSGVKASPKPVAPARRTVTHAAAASVVAAASSLESPPPPTSTPPHTAVESTAVTKGSQSTSTLARKENDSSHPQGSGSPRCSSEPQERETWAVPGGASTTGERARSGHSSQTGTDTSVAVRHTPLKAKAEPETLARTTEINVEPNQQNETHQRQETEKRKPDTAANIHSNKEESTSPPLSPKEDDQEEQEEQSRQQTEDKEDHSSHQTQEDDNDKEDQSSQQTEDASPESVEVDSPRKWCILDQSGSLFLQGTALTPVPVARDLLRQVSSLQPSELRAALRSANEDLDGANLPRSLELRVVSARQLGGEAVALDVAQREDYFVQVTRVHSKDSSVQEADLLMSVDGHSQRHRRPAQVHTQLDSTGPKGVLLTARGLRLPASVSSALAAAEDSKDDNKGTPSAPTPPPSSPRTPRASDSPAKAVEVGEGVLEVTMTKGPAGVGISLEGGKGSAKGDLPIVIKRIFKGGPAEKGGVLRVKDEILAVNGVDYSAMGHYEAWNHLKAQQDGPVTIRIRRQQQ